MFSSVRSHTHSLHVHCSLPYPCDQRTSESSVGNLIMVAGCIVTQLHIKLYVNIYGWIMRAPVVLAATECRTKNVFRWRG